MLFQPFLSCQFRNFVQRNVDLTASVQQNSLQRVVPQPEFKASLVNTGNAWGFPRSPSQHVRTLHPGFLSHVLNSCLDPGANRFVARPCRHGRNLKLASQRESAAAWLWVMGSAAAPAQCPLVTHHVWVLQAALLAQVPQHHHGSSMAPCKERGTSSLPDGNYCIASWWFRNFPGHRKVQVQDCGSRGRSGLQSPATANALAWREKQELCPDNLFCIQSKMFPSVQKCRQTEHEARDLLQDKRSFPYILKMGVFFTFVNKMKALHYKLNSFFFNKWKPFQLGG